jgi:hypothetical protein
MLYPLYLRGRTFSQTISFEISLIILHYPAFIPWIYPLMGITGYLERYERLTGMVQKDN